MANRLHKALSPYLLQHKDNPVAWYPWAQAAFLKAQQENKPIFLSIGYAACHWCHVMAHESFEDHDIADYLNQHFVSIKVDREEHPEVDKIYMDAIIRLHGQGGWPLTVFLTPQGKPFFGGTYFPNQPRYGQPGFSQVLQQVMQAWGQQRDAIDATADDIARDIGRKIMPVEDQVVLTVQDIVQFKREQSLDFDLYYGGLSGAPKFPQIPLWQCLFSIGCYSQDKGIIKQCYLTADNLCAGGIYDHVGGGWMRYSTDEEWLAPHFEKMLYDNALIISYLSELNQYEPRPYYKTVVSQTIDWLQREMRIDQGLYATSLDADSEGVEGKFYVWDEADIDRIRSDQLDQFKQCFDISESGNWEGKNILRIKNLADLSHQYQDELQQLLDMRQQRVRPAIDDKCLTEWNALLVIALVKASVSFDEPLWFDHAKQLYDTMAATLYQDECWVHCYRQGQYSDNLLLDDQATMIMAQLMLYLYSGEAVYLNKATQQVACVEALFLDKDNHLFNMAPSDACPYISNPQVIQDNATPSGNGVMAVNYAMLYHITGEQQRRAMADHLFSATSQVLNSRHNIYHGSLTYAWLLLHVGGKLTVAPDNFSTVDAQFKSPLYLRENTLAAGVQLCQGNVCR